MKKICYERCSRELSALNEKCDIIIELLDAVLDNPDFLIDRLRCSVERQHQASREPKMKVVRHETR